MYAKREIPAPFSEKTTPFSKNPNTPKPQQITDFSPLFLLLLLDLISAKS